MKPWASSRVRKNALYAVGTLSLLLLSCGDPASEPLTVTSMPSSLTIYPGQQGIPIDVTVSGGTSGPISVTLAGLPSGIVVSSLRLNAGGAGTLMLSASRSAGQEGYDATTNPVPTNWTAKVIVVASTGTEQATSQLSLTISISNPTFAPAPADINLPIVKIDTNAVAIVDKVTDVPGNISITSADGQTSYLPNASDSDNTATFHVHGTSTAVMPKLPYHDKLNTSLDLLGTMGLTCPYVTSSGKPICDKSKSYILLANYDDKTFLRNWSASALANAIPIGNGYLDSPSDSPTPSGTSALMPWAPHSLFVELYLNGVYEGNYQLIEEVKVDSHRINITELSEADTAPAKVNGGYLMEIDAHQTEAYVFRTLQNLSIGLVDPDFSPDSEIFEQASYVSNYVNVAETALFASSFTDSSQGWRAYFDESSAVNFYIVNDVMGNVDGGDFLSSVYLYKNRNNPLIYMGPVWDFDISSGNVNYAPIVSPTVPWMQVNAPWYVQWFKDPGFKADVVTQWNTLKTNGVFTAWLASIRQQAESLEQSQVNNFGRWPMQGIEVWPNSEAASGYDGEVAFFLNWLELRIAYLDSVFNNKAQTTTALRNLAGTARSGCPVTLTAQVSGGFAPTGVVSFMSGGVLLGTSSLDSGGAASLTTSNLPAGTRALRAVYHGDRENALSASAVRAVTFASPLSATVTSLSVPSSIDSQDSSAEFTASVVANSGTAVPTGTVTFRVDESPIVAVKLDRAGRASYTAASLAAGTHGITAAYSGDANHSASAGLASLAVTIVPARADKDQTANSGVNDQFAGIENWLQQGIAYVGSLLDDHTPAFSISLAPASLTLELGQRGTSVVSIAPRNGFAGTVYLSCSGLPPGASCSLSPAMLAPSDAAVTTTLSVSTATPLSDLGRPSQPPTTAAITITASAGPLRRTAVLSLTVRGVSGKISPEPGIRERSQAFSPSF